MDNNVRTSTESLPEKLVAVQKCLYSRGKRNHTGPSGVGSCDLE